MKNLEIQANFKVNFLRRNAEMTRINNFEAKLNLEFMNKKWDFTTLCNLKESFLNMYSII